MRQVTVSGLYRHDIKGHTEQGIKPYHVSFLANRDTDSLGVCIKNAAIILNQQDPSFDSLKTHKVEWNQEEPLVSEPTVEEPLDVEPNGQTVEPTGENSGAELFE